MRIRWSPDAAADLEEIVNRIRRDNPSAAQNVAKTLYERISSLTKFPNRGRPGRIEGSRELVFAPLPYILVYRVKEQVVEIGPHLPRCRKPALARSRNAEFAHDNMFSRYCEDQRGR
jgi:addiction module RelE/StbE family toxin